MLNKLHTLTSLLLLILILALPVIAQESTETPPEAANPPAIEDLPVSASEVLDYAAFGQSAIVVLIVYLVMELLKRLPIASNYDPFKLSTVVTGILYLGYQTVFVFGGDVGAYMAYLADIGNAGNSVLSLFMTFAGATGLHHVRKNTGAMLAPKAPLPAKDL